MIAPLMPKPALRGASAPLDDARGSRRDLLRSAGRHRVAVDPQRSAPAQHDIRLLRALAGRGTVRRINRTLVMADRERAGREASPTAAVLKCQSVKTTESGGPRSYDAGKKIKGRKRQALVDTDGRALVLDPQGADIQDRDGAGPVLRLSRRTFPFIVKAFADAGYAGDRPATAGRVSEPPPAERDLACGEAYDAPSCLPPPWDRVPAARGLHRADRPASGAARRRPG